MRHSIKLVLASFALVSRYSLSASTARAELQRLTVDERVSQLLASTRLRHQFGWELTPPDAFDATQRSYSIKVATSKENSIPLIAGTAGVVTLTKPSASTMPELR